MTSGLNLIFPKCGKCQVFAQQVTNMEVCISGVILEQEAYNSDCVTFLLSLGLRPENSEEGCHWKGLRREGKEDPTKVYYQLLHTSGR